MIITKDIAQKVLNVLNNQSCRNDCYDEFKKEFEDDPIWYILALASYWDNDLQGWCQAIIDEDIENFFAPIDEAIGEEIIPSLMVETSEDWSRPAKTSCKALLQII